MNDSASAKPTQQSSEAFTPPGATELASLTDGRGPGDFRTKYPLSAWIQIALELAYLLILQLTCFSALVLLAIYVSRGQDPWQIFNIFGTYPQSVSLVAYTSITLGGACGGCTFALKWLFHTVAKQQWHRDRVVWRIVVPVSSAFLAVFSGLMIISGLVPFLARAPLMVPATGAAYGFFVGLFSDNVLAALQRLAYNVFGTVDKQKAPGLDETKSSGPT